MANQRDKNKKSINLWVTDEERDMLKSAARKHGYGSVTEFIKAAARGAVKVDPKIKAIALAAIGANGGCVGLLMFFAGLVGAVIYGAAHLV